ncbi:hypothetical protein [Kitasatospora sp. NPDC006786]|uniref:hypothetical protein n=1 Tax=unclassified Kitasatospora TaxID=2633591 RepID=UPI0033F2ED90
MVGIKEVAAMSDREYFEYLTATPAIERPAHVLGIGRLVRADHHSKERFRFTRARLWLTGASLQTAINEQWNYKFFVEQFLAALAELALGLLTLAAEGIMPLLSKLLSGFDEDEPLLWKPVPIDKSPQNVPRGPNSAFPVRTYRGGRRGSALGNVVVTA